MTDKETRDTLVRYAERYETAAFLDGDPSWFMHQVEGCQNQEAMAFIASGLSYGRRPQFMAKLQQVLEWTGGDVDEWVRSGGFGQHFAPDDTRCFYRLYNHATMYRFLNTYQQLLNEHGTLGEYVRTRANTGFEAVDAICRGFAASPFDNLTICAGSATVVPRDTQSACKRVCMFLRWMVRSNSPVDLGLWSDFIDRRTLIMPLDTHVLQQSVRLGLLASKTATMTTARQLTNALTEIFPDDPLRGDFALFGYGVNNHTI